MNAPSLNVLIMLPWGFHLALTAALRSHAIESGCTAGHRQDRKLSRTSACLSSDEHDMGASSAAQPTSQLQSMADVQPWLTTQCPGLGTHLIP